MSDLKLSKTRTRNLPKLNHDPKYLKFYRPQALYKYWLFEDKKEDIMFFSAFNIIYDQVGSKPRYSFLSEPVAFWRLDPDPFFLEERIPMFEYEKHYLIEMF